MTDRSQFTIEPWGLHEAELDLDRLSHTETVFALSNGHIGLRGNLDEGEPFGLPGTYLNGFYESRPLGERQPTERLSTPARRSSVRVWWSSSP